MFSDYKTAIEMADEWHISLRYIQVLCQRGRIEGAVKKTGSWFIPSTAQKPSDPRKKSRNE